MNAVCHYVCYIELIYDVCNVITVNLCTYIPSGTLTGLFVELHEWDEIKCEIFLTVSPLLSHIFFYCLLQLGEDKLPDNLFQFRSRSKYSSRHSLKFTYDYKTVQSLETILT